MDLLDQTNHRPSLSWPLHAALRQPFERKASPFEVTLSQATGHALDELDKSGAENVVVTCNVDLTLVDGTRRRLDVDRPAVSVLFHLDGASGRRAAACDKYSDMIANIRAIGLTVEARRHAAGYGVMGNAPFSGVPLGRDTREWWRKVLGVSETADLKEAQRAYRGFMLELHPDHNDDYDEADKERMMDVRQAWEFAQRHFVDAQAT